MKKPVKITLISLCSLLAVIVIAVIVAINMVFSPERLTKLVRQYASDYVTCQTEIGEVDLTLFGNFPKVSLRINDVVLINPMEGAQSDTLLAVGTLFAELDVMEYLSNDRVSVTGFTLRDASANLFISADSLTNFDIIRLESAAEGEEKPDTTASALDQMSLRNISVRNLNASYVDNYSGMSADVHRAEADLSTEASLQTLSGGADVSLRVDDFFYQDSINYGYLSGIRLAETHLTLDGNDATARIPRLDVGEQTYRLSGESPLVAQIWDMVLDDFDLTWKESRPTLTGVTRLDSAKVTMGDKEKMYVTTGAVVLDMPVTSTTETWTTNVDTKVRQLVFAMDPDGVLVDHMDIDSRFVASTSSSFNDFNISDMCTTAGGQTVDGNVHVDMTDSTVIKADVSVNVHATTVSELLALVPKAYRSALRGIDVNARLDDSHIAATCEVMGNKFKLRKTSVATSVHRLDYADDTKLTAAFDGLSLDVSYPAGQRGRHIRVQSALQGLSVAQSSDSMKFSASLPDLAFTALVQDDVIDGRDPILSADFRSGAISATVDDTVSVSLAAISGKADVDMRSVKKCIKVSSNTEISSFGAKMGNTLSASIAKMALDLKALYDERQQDVLDQLSPDARFTLSDGSLTVDGIPYPVLMPSVDASFNKDKAVLASCQLNVGNSDLGLKGMISNINSWLKQQALLEGNLNLDSKHVDVDQLMDLTSGFGAETSESPEASSEDPESPSESSSDPSSAPFMVPKDVKFVVNTNVSEIAVNGNTFENVGGQLTCDDGVLVLEEMGFTSKAAKMQLTALYKSPRENNLFVGWNFHLLDIDIAEMIRLVPEIDTIVPMLSAFQGKAEFHLAGETGLYRDYSPKMSSLKAVAAIEGKDLTILDNETFQTIKKYLFKDCTTNKIDTISVELAVARKKMTLYPMLIGWDKYEAIIAGTHTIVDSMPFNYNISITKCPLVGGHLGLDITGNLDDIDNISYSLGGCKYANLYRPEKRNITQAQTLELKQLISTSLKRMVK